MIIDIIVLSAIFFISGISVLVGALTISGMLASLFVGFSIYLGTGVRGLLLLLWFFATSSFWSKWKSDEKRKIDENFIKGDARNWIQVVANGAIPAILSLLYRLRGEKVFLFALAAGLASANADTWASEIGILSRKNPVDPLTFRPMERGTSGAVSLPGTVAAFLGSFSTAVLSSVLWIRSLSLSDGMLITLLGFFNMFLDSLMGRFFQERFQCAVCGKIVEQPAHCGKRGNRIRGIPHFSNHAVNFCSLLCTTVIGILIYPSC